MNERKVFFETIASTLQDKDNVVLLGDFNWVCAREDRADLTRNRDPSARLLQNILDEHYLTDVAHCAAKADALRYTHFQGDSHARLDGIYVSHGLAPSCKNYAVDYVALCDPCLLSFLLGGRREGCNKFHWNSWKFNAKILKDEKFNEEVKEIFDRNTRLGKESWGSRWESFKQESKMCAIERGTVLTRLEREEETKLRNNLRQLLILECERPGVFIEDIALQQASSKL